MQTAPKTQSFEHCPIYVAGSPILPLLATSAYAHILLMDIAAFWLRTGALTMPRVSREWPKYRWHMQKPVIHSDLPVVYFNNAGSLQGHK